MHEPRRREDERSGRRLHRLTRELEHHFALQHVKRVGVLAMDVRSDAGFGYAIQLHYEQLRPPEFRARPRRYGNRADFGVHSGR